MCRMKPEYRDHNHNESDVYEMSDSHGIEY
jgi:hypothetical protein